MSNYPRLDEHGLTTLLNRLAQVVKINSVTDIKDVNINSLQDGQILKYDSSTQKWLNENDEGGGHTIITASSLPMAGQPNLQFEGVHVENVGQAGQGKTVIKPQFHVCATEAEWNQMTDAEKNDPLIYWVRPWASSFALDSDRTPVGTVVSIGCELSTIDPQDSLISFPNNDYLICKGTVCNISSYPQLANYIESAYGSKNYFGGDGTTTFAVPDWSADFPENGILCIKAQISSTAITFAEVDETGIYAGDDKVPSCARVAEIEESLSDSGVLSNKITAGIGVTINTQKIKKKGNVVNLYVLVTTPQTAADLTIGTIDSAYRPSFNQSLVGMAHTGDSGQKECQIDINTNGQIVSHYHTTYKYIFFSATYLTS